MKKVIFDNGSVFEVSDDTISIAPVGAKEVFRIDEEKLSSSELSDLKDPKKRSNLIDKLKKKI